MKLRVKNFNDNPSWKWPQTYPWSRRWFKKFTLLKQYFFFRRDSLDRTPNSLSALDFGKAKGWPPSYGSVGSPTLNLGAGSQAGGGSLTPPPQLSLFPGMPNRLGAGSADARSFSALSAAAAASGLYQPRTPTLSGTNLLFGFQECWIFIYISSYSTLSITNVF